MFLFFFWQKGVSQSQEIEATRANSKQVTFRYLNNENGLSQNSVLSIAQDSTGYLWVATRSGLNRYDGNSFKYYNKQFDAFDTKEGNEKILGKVFVNRQDELWIISAGGKLEKYQKEQDTFVSIKALDSVVNLFQDSHSNMYFSKYNGALVSINFKTKDTTKVFQLPHKGFIQNMIQVHEDSLYLSPSNKLYSYHVKTHEYKELVNNYSTKNYTFVQSKKGDVWLGTLGDGLYYKTSTSNSFLPATEINNKLPSDLYILSLYVDKYERLWVCTLKEGIFLLDLRLNTIEKLKFQKGNLYALSDNEILDIYEDSNGVIWLGTNVSGLAYYDEYLSKFNVLTSNQTPEGIHLETVLAVATDYNENIFIGTTNGLTIFNTTTKAFKQITDKNTLLPNNAVSALLYLDGKLWIGNSRLNGVLGGLSILDASGKIIKQPVTFNNNEKVQFINRIFLDSKNQIWISTGYGLAKLDTKNWNAEALPYKNKNAPLITSKIVRCIIEDEKENLWVATPYNEVYMVDLNANKTQLITNTFQNIKCIQFDPENKDVLWIGTNGNGLFRYNIKTKNSENFSLENGFPDNVIYGILPDENNNLWLSSNRGIIKFSYTDVDTFKVENFGTNDGLQGLEFNTNAYFKDKNGVLYFGGLKGINWFKPEHLTKNPYLPKTIISTISVLDTEIDAAQESSFDSNKNTISFRFQSLNFSKPNGNTFKYRLLNHHDTWHNAGTNNEVRYVNLPPNTYTFQVISGNYDGVWNPEPASYTFTILKPWYATNLAKISYVLLFILIAVLLYRYLKWRWQVKNQLQLEHQETQRLKKLDAFKTKLYTNISHEFRTPLTLISGPIENQLAKPNLSKQDQDELSLIKRSAIRLLNLVNQMLDLSKLESGNLKLAVLKDNLPLLLKQLVKSFEFKAAKKHIVFTNTITPIKEAWFDREVIEKIVTNLLSNAVKYTPEYGKIHFESKVQEGQVIISVVNTGNTLTDQDLTKLFKRYYQTSKNNDGVGIGLSLVKELTLLCHGNIVAHTFNDEIQFTVTLPIARAFFNANEISEEISTNKKELDLRDEPEKRNLNNTTTNNKPLMLIVEDDEDIQLFVKSIFKNSYKVKQAYNGEVGVKSALKYIPDIIISDVMMPKVDGIALCNTLKFDERTSHIPIILLTAKSGHENEMQGLKTGADDYITKPFNTKRLQLKVDKLIENRRQLQKYFSKTLSINPELAITSTEADFLKRLQAVLNKHITNSEFNSEAFSKHMQISRAQLHRKLKAITNMTTSEFIRSQRLKLAKELLQKSDATISEIAYQVGFNTPSYFIKCFKEIYHCTPNEFQSKAL